MLGFYQAWYRQNLQVAIPVSIVVGIVLLLIIFSLLRCVKRCCCGRSKPVVPKTPVVAAIPSNVPGQRIPSWTSLQNNTNDNTNEVRSPGRHGRNNSSQPLMYNSVPPQQRGYSPAFNDYGNGRRSEDGNPFLTTGERTSLHPVALRPGGSMRSIRPPPGPPPPPLPLPDPVDSGPSYPLPPAAPRQSTWGNSPGMAGVGSGQPGARRLSQSRSNWVDDQAYNGPR